MKTNTYMPLMKDNPYIIDKRMELEAYENNLYSLAESFVDDMDDAIYDDDDEYETCVLTAAMILERSMMAFTEIDINDALDEIEDIDIDNDYDDFYDKIEEMYCEGDDLIEVLYDSFRMTAASAYVRFHNNCVAYCDEAIEEIRNGEYKKGYKKLRLLAKREYGAAEGVLGADYLTGKNMVGKNVEKDHFKAIEYLTRAVKHGCKNAAYPLARCYFEGLGVRQDPERAEKILRENGCKVNQYAVSFVYSKDGKTWGKASATVYAGSDAKAISKIKSEYPYVEEIHITRVS